MYTILNKDFYDYSLHDESYYESDEFRMYGFKIKVCPKTRSHDWTMCPFAHRGERARRRDPRKYNYAPVSCPDFKADGECRRGDFCHFAHGIFEYWLHPAKYRTHPCNAAGFCQRKVCFFAHSPAQLRGDFSGGVAATSLTPPRARADREMGFNVDLEFLRRMRNLKLKEKNDNEEKTIGFGLNGSDLDYQDFKWVSELLDEM